MHHHTCTLVAAAIALAPTSMALSQPSPTPPSITTIRPDQLPGPDMLGAHQTRLERLQTAVFPLRVVLDLHTPHYSVAPLPAFGAAVLLQLPGQEDEPGVLITTTQLLQRAKSLDIRHPDGSWHPATVILQDSDRGLAVLNAALPTQARPLATASINALPATLNTVAFDGQHNLIPHPARLGPPGPDALAFYRTLNTPHASPGAPVVDEHLKVHALVGLAIAQGKHRGHWALNRQTLHGLLQRLADPTAAHDKARVHKQTLQLTNPLNRLPQ
ncbi:MAG: hypothetical protein AAFS10_08350 [Myxococcota bacterium]